MSFKESKDGGFGPMTDGPLGAIELGFFKKGDSINICIYQARGLKSFDSNGYSDPYIKFQILPDAKPSTKRKTRVRTHSPTKLASASITTLRNFSFTCTSGVA